VFEASRGDSLTVQRIAIVGGGQAAAVATRTLRRRGYEGSIVILGDEPERPYQRPPLSKEYLTDKDESSLWLLPEVWTDTNSVEVRTGVTARRINASAGTVELSDGSSIDTDAVLIATGGRARRLHGAESSRIHYLRTKADADRLRNAIGPGARVIIVGAGFIGAEAASSALQMGAETTVIGVTRVPLQRVLGDRLGEVCADLQRDAGVDLRLGIRVEAVREQDDSVVVETPDGSIVGDIAVVAIGILPNQEIAEVSGIEVGNGILVDEYCRTGVPNIYAAGDVANQYHPLYQARMRVEHFDNASKQASAAANNMIGWETAFTDPHWFWSDQFGTNLQGVGHPAARDDMVVRGDIESRDFTAFFVHDGRVRSAFAMNRGEDITIARELIIAGVVVAENLLADPDYDLFEALEQR
jgi:3-phenylpropionate/trans-cinnamate dioxygenase ferredoxin reductase subunit